MNNRKTMVLYGIIFILGCAFFLYSLFPEDKVNRHLMYMFRQALPDCRIDIEKSRPSFPIALSLSNVMIFKSEEEIMKADAVKIGRPALSLFSSGAAYSIKAKAYGGKINGMVTTDNTLSAGKVSTDLEMSGLEIDSISILDRILDDPISGILNGTVTYDSLKPTDQGDIHLHLSDVSIPVSVSFFNFGNIRFTDIWLEGSLNQRDFSIQKGHATGRQADIDLSGIMVIKNPFDNSLLNFSGTFKAHPELLQNIPLNIFPAGQMDGSGLPFVITGTLKKPVVSIR